MFGRHGKHKARSKERAFFLNMFLLVRNALDQRLTIESTATQFCRTDEIVEPVHIGTHFT